MILAGIIKTLKIKHYVKNLVVLVPLIFSLNIFNPKLFLMALTAVLGFCFVSSAVYVMNDLVDIDKDKKHPIKSKRPIASGEISKTAAVLLMLFLLITSILITGFNKLCMYSVLVYFLLNIIYSFKLKDVFLVDATCIALGFILRILAGCFAISVIPSPLVILMTFFISMFFTFTKRRLELKLLTAQNEERASLKGISEQEISKFIIINAVLSVSFYITYMLDKTTIMRAGTEYLYITVIPFTLIIYRLLFLSDTKLDDDDPLHLFKKDKPLLFFILFYLVTFIFVIIF
ncbi:MAG: UbiA prenyltransferase family protein [Candidatus Gastranaerophilales bacterium]|nr:UbiA prenyltransferase family protein [Candidatus Gastranaerophilales bacterium]